MLDKLAAWPLERFPHRPLLRRVWELKDNATAYDASYIALAERLGVPLLTCDDKQNKVPGHDATVVCFAHSAT